MRLSLLGISISLLGIAILLATATTFGLILSGLGFVVTLISCFIGEVEKVKGFLK